MIKNMKSKKFLHKYPPKRWFRNENNSLLIRDDVRERKSADIFHRRPISYDA